MAQRLSDELLTELRPEGIWSTSAEAEITGRDHPPNLAANMSIYYELPKSKA